MVTHYEILLESFLFSLSLKYRNNGIEKKKRKLDKIKFL